MDRIFSVRLSPEVIARIGETAGALHLSKKALVEAAVNRFAAEAHPSGVADVFDQTSGAWRRAERPAESVQRARKTFSDSMARRKR